jgi:type IV secretory pathway component VirB8
MEQHKKDDTVHKFLANPSSPEVDIQVEKVTLDDMQNPPYRASVDFYQIEYAPADHSVLRKTLHTANFVLLFKDEVPNDLIPVNPLGMTITYFRQDEAFSDEVTR